MSTVIKLQLNAATPIQLKIVRYDGPGPRGYSAYEIAVSLGFVGTEAEWLESLKGESGAGNILSRPAGENISGNRLVYVLNGEVFYYDPEGPYEPTGVSINAALTGDDVDVVMFGPANVPGWGLTPGTMYYAGPNGVISDTPAVAGRVQQIGTAEDSDTLFVNIQQPIIL